MPTYGSFGGQPWEIDPKRWARCLQRAADSMIAQGRHPRALCPGVKVKRAHRFWREGAA